MTRPKVIRFSLTALTVILVVLCEPACSRSSKALRATARADNHFAAGQYDAAEIEYLNTLQINANNPYAIGRLGIIYFDDGRVIKSKPYLLYARKTEPQNLEIRFTSGLYYLTVGEFAQARDESMFILDHEPKYPDAPLLLAESANSPSEISAARERLNRLPTEVSGSAPVLVALGTLDFREHHLRESEDRFKQALVKDPHSSAACTALGVLYWRRKDMADAEQAFAKAADLGSPRSAKRLQYAQFKLQTGDRTGARLILEEVARKAPDYLPALMFLAQLDAAEKRTADSETVVNQVLQRDPTYRDALLLAGGLSLSKGEVTRAVAILSAGAQLYPHDSELLYAFAQAHIAEHKPDAAIGVLNRAVADAPRFAEAALALAQLKIQTGDIASAVVTLRQLIKVRPEVEAAYNLLARAYLGQDNATEALAVYQQVAAATPNNPEPVVQEAITLMRLGRGEEARQLLETVRTKAPNYFPCLEQLVALDLGEKDYAAARRRVDAAIALDPKQAGDYLLLGKIYYAQQDYTAAETALKKAIEAQPDSAAAYYLLAQLYVESKRDRDALANLQAVTAKNPNDTNALMMMGLIQEQEKSYSAARDTYEKAVAANPDFTPALNNLAYIDAEYFSNFDKAFALAQHARQLLPNEPLVADTLGWIQYKRREYQWALSLLEESASNSPGDPENQFHLGMAQYMIGQEAAARVNLKKAVEAKAEFQEVQLARDSLMVLWIDPATAGPGERAFLEKAAAARPDDPGVLSRLAILYNLDGKNDKAIATSESVLKINPKHLPTLIGLVKLFADRGDLATAIGYAKQARDLAPEDPDIARTLGQLAFRTKDYAWSYSLLQDAAARKLNDPDLNFDLAQTAYSLGRTAGAESALQSAVNANPSFSNSDQANRFLELLVFAENPTPAKVDQIQQLVKGSSIDVPGLMALGTIAEMKADLLGAKMYFEQVLAIYPAFSPAKRQLVLIAEKESSNDSKDLDWATGAREAYPDDPEVAKACGIIAYRNSDFQRAKSLLTESASKKGADGELLFYLGMTQFRLKDGSSRATLERAIGLELKPDQTVQAKQILAETNKT